MSVIPKEENGSKKEKSEDPLLVLTRLSREESLLLRELPDKRPLRLLLVDSHKCTLTQDTSIVKDKEILTLILFLMDRLTLILMKMVTKIIITMKDRLIHCTLKNTLTPTLTKMVLPILMLILT